MGYQLTTLVLGPILLVQGYRVRQRIPKLPEAPGPREGVSGQGRQLRLLILGDSAAAGVGAPSQDQALLGQTVSRLSQGYCVEWRLSAKTGHKTADTLATLDRLRPQQFDVVVTSLGVNDVTGGVSSAAWRRRQLRLRERLRTELGATLVIVSGLPPVHGFPALPQPLRWYLGSRARRFSRLLAQDVAADPGCRFLPIDFTEDAALMASDGFHPGPGIYSAWGRRVAELVEAELEGAAPGDTEPASCASR